MFSGTVRASNRCCCKSSVCVLRCEGRPFVIVCGGCDCAQLIHTLFYSIVQGCTLEAASCISWFRHVHRAMMIKQCRCQQCDCVNSHLLCSSNAKIAAFSASSFAVLETVTARVRCGCGKQKG